MHKKASAGLKSFVKAYFISFWSKLIIEVFSISIQLFYNAVTDFERKDIR